MDNLEAHNERMKRVVSSLNDDRISQLPQNVIHHILMLLPTKDAAKTAFMSRQWRRHWRSIPQLLFDDGFTRITEPSATNKLIMNIHKSLLAHDGPVAKFVLAIPGLTPCDEIDYIILNLSGTGVREFTLKFASGRRCAYRLPSSLFTALQLKLLKLQLCLFMVPPWFVGFNKLTVLDLREVSLPFDFYENFLPKCPLIEDLKLVLCKGPAELELDVPRLKVFFFCGHLLKMCFKHTPVLSKLGLYVYGLQEPDFLALFASLPVLQELQVSSEFLKILRKGGHFPSIFPTPLYLLRNFHVRIFGGLEEQVLVCLIMSSPNLHMLSIQYEVHQQEDKLVTGVGSLLEAEHHNHGPCLQHLKVVRFKNSLGTPLELELARFILATAPQLVRIQIKSSPLLCSRKVIKFMKEVLRYKRISEAEVIYDWNDDEKD